MDISNMVSRNMATVLQRGKKKTWYAVYRDLNGKQRWNRVKEASDRKGAQAAADLLEATAQKKKNAQALRKTFSDLYREFYGQSLPTTTVRAYAQGWLAQKKPEAADSTYRAYDQVIALLLDFLKERIDQDLADISKSDLVAFRNHYTTKIGAGRVNFYVKVLRMFFRAAHRDGYLLENPAAYLEIVRNRSNERRRPFTVEEIRSVLSIADPEWQSLIRLGLYTGQRLADLAALTWSNVDLESNEIRLTTRKTDRRLTIPIAGPLREHLVSSAGKDDPAGPLHPKAFSTLSKDGRAASLSNEFVGLLSQAGFREEQTHKGRGIGRNAKRRTSKLSFHSLRHTAVSLLKDAGIPQATVMELIGHDSEQMSALYTHVGREALQKAAAALPEV
jgi:integrase